LTFIIVPFGSGLKTYSRTLNWSLTGFGMLKSYIGLRATILYGFMMNLGQQIHFGTFRYVFYLVHNSFLD